MPERATSRLGSSVLDLSVDDRAFNKGIKGVVDHTKHAHRAFDTMGIKAEKLSGRIGNLNKGLKLLGGAGVLGSVIVGMAAFTRAVTNNIIEMKVLAATAGLSTKAMQEYSYIARQAGVSQAGLIDGVKELNLRIDEFAKTGYGPGAEALVRLGYTMDDFNSQLIDSDDRFASVINSLMQIDDIASRMRIADEVFGGTGGEQYERVIRLLIETSSSMTELRQRAHDLGIVLDDELVDNVRNLHLRFLELKDVVSTQLTKAILDLLPPAEDLDEILQEKIPLAVQKAIEQFEKLRENIKKLGLQFEELLRTLNYVVAGWAAMKAFAMTKALPTPVGVGIATAAGLGAGEHMSNITGQPGPLDDLIAAGGKLTDYIWDELAAYGILKKRIDDVGDSMGELEVATDELKLATGETVDEPHSPKPVEPFYVKDFFDTVTGMVENRLSFQDMSAEYQRHGLDYRDSPRFDDIKAYIDRDALQALDPGFAYLPAFGDVLKTATADLKSMGFDMSGSNEQVRQQFSQKGIFEPRQIGRIIAGAFERSMVKLMIQLRADAGAGPPGLESSIGVHGFAGPGTAQWEASAGRLTNALELAAAEFGMYAGGTYFDPTATPGEEEEIPGGGIETAGDAVGFADLAAQSAGLADTFTTLTGTTSFLNEIINGGLSPQAIALKVILMLVKEVLVGLFRVIGPAIGNILRPLFQILQAIGQFVGAVLTPIFALLAIPLQLVGALFQWLYDNVLIHVGNAFIALANLIGAIANFFGANFKKLDYLKKTEPSEKFSFDDLGDGLGDDDDGTPSPFDDDNDPWANRDPEGEAEGGDRPTFRQQRPIDVTINFPGNVYAVGEGGFREFAELMAEEFKRLGYLGR